MNGRIRLRHIAVWYAILLSAALPVWPQSKLPETQEEALVSFVGMTLNELFRQFGVPRTVYTARGDEQWQDDVVFSYNEGDFYIFGDRVWQVGLKSACGLKTGDVKAVALMVFGETAQDKGDYILCPLPGGSWPLSLRVNVGDGRITGFFIYRTDF